jgi:hypothetical protein
MTRVSEKEIERQYRVLQQTLSAHSSLRDRAARKAKGAKSILLALSILFSVTTFAGNGFYEVLGVDPQIGRLTVGFASLIAVITSVILLIIDWEGEATRHSEAANRWSAVLRLFRTHRDDEGSWHEEQRVALSAAYWEADRNSASIPERVFNKLKARHLRKVATSKLISSYPGCPRILLWGSVWIRDTLRAFWHRFRTQTNDKVEP